MNIKEHEKNFYEFFKKYNMKYQEWPESCYCPVLIYDDLIEEIRKKAIDLSHPLNRLYSDIYFSTVREHYLTIFGVRLYRSIVTEMDCNAPKRQNEI